MISAPPVTTGTARFDPRGRYRYRLTRVWDDRRPVVVWIMLNPSTATASADDPTIRRVVGFSRAWGFGSAEVVNLFALRATHPRRLANSHDRVGPLNDDSIATAVTSTHRVVAAWGNHGTMDNPATGNPRCQEVVALISKGCGDVRCLATTKRGHPRHPLYVPADTSLTMFH